MHRRSWKAAVMTGSEAWSRTATVGELMQRADEKLHEERYREALALYARIVELKPLHLDARLRVADALLALGEVQQAAVVYAKLAQHAAHAGYPLRALVAIKILSALEPQLGELVRSVAALYGRDSRRLGRGVRRSLPNPQEPVAYDPHADGGVASTSAEQAGRLASDYQHRDVLYPDRLMPIPLLSLLSREEFAGVVAAIRLVRARRGARLIEQGAPGRSFFVLARGEAEVIRRDTQEREQQLSVLREGAVFGEMALLSNASRSASVRALVDCDVLEFDRDALSGAAEAAGNLEAALAAFARERLLRNVLNTAAVFRPLDAKQRHDLMRRFVPLEVSPRTTLIRQGDSGQGLYVVLQGQVGVTRREDGGEVTLATLQAGDVFGEMSLLADEPASASVTALQAGTLLFLGREYFARLLEAVPDVRAQLDTLREERALDTRISMASLARLATAPVDQEEALPRADQDEIEIEVLL